MVPLIELTDAGSGKTLLAESVKDDVLIDLAPVGHHVGIGISGSSVNVGAAIELQNQTLGRRNKINVSVKPDRLGNVVTTTGRLLETGYQTNHSVVATEVLISLIS